MRYQSVPGRCGPAALREALAAIGVQRSEDELAALAKTTVDGTSPRGLLRALSLLELEREPAYYMMEARADIAYIRVAEALREERPVVLCVDNYNHWVAVTGFLGASRPRFVVADAGHEERILYLTAPELLSRWRGPARLAYCGVVI